MNARSVLFSAAAALAALAGPASAQVSGKYALDLAGAQRVAGAIEAEEIGRAHV